MLLLTYCKTTAIFHLKRVVASSLSQDSFFLNLPRDNFIVIFLMHYPFRTNITEIVACGVKTTNYVFGLSNKPMCCTCHMKFWIDFVTWNNVLSRQWCAVFVNLRAVLCVLILSIKPKCVCSFIYTCKLVLFSIMIYKFCSVTFILYCFYPFFILLAFDTPYLNIILRIFYLHLVNLILFFFWSNSRDSI